MRAPADRTGRVGPVYGAPLPPTAPVRDDAARRLAALRRRAVTQFLVGAAMSGVGAVSAIVSSSPHGGIGWVGSFVVGASLVVRGVRGYRQSRRIAVTPVPGLTVRTGRTDVPLLAGAAVVVAAVLVLAGVAVARTVARDQDASAARSGVGSCWVADGASVDPVACRHAHDYVGEKVVTDRSQCPQDSAGDIVQEDGALLCLRSAG